MAWTVAAAETGELAEAFIADAIDSQHVDRDQLTLHADRGTSMTSKPVAQLLVDLGVTRSHSRPSVSNDNPYSEAQFKTTTSHRPRPRSSPRSRGSTKPTEKHSSNPLEELSHRNRAGFAL